MTRLALFVCLRRGWSVVRRRLSASRRSDDGRHDGRDDGHVPVGAAPSVAQPAAPVRPAGVGAEEALLPRAPAVVARDAAGHVTVRAVRTDQPIRIDGRLDEAIYEIDGGHRRLPAAGAERRAGRPPSRPRRGSSSTTDNIYVSARCWDTHPERMVANEMRRDTNQLRQNDTFGVLFDTYHDRRNGYFFYANPIGGLADSQITDENPPNTDWNTIWDVKTGRFERRLDHRDGDSVQVAALCARARSDVGHQPAARRAMEERVVAPHADSAGADDLPRHPEDFVGGDAGRPPGAAGAAERSSSSRTRSRSVSTDRHDVAGDRATIQPDAVGGDVEVRRHAEPDRRLHRQHRLRAGGGRRAAGEPHALQPVLPGEARLLPRRAGDVRVRRASECRVSAPAPGDTPYLFFSRRIGLDGARTVDRCAPAGD